VTRRHLLAGLGAGLIGGAAGVSPALAAPVRGARKAAAADLARGGMADWAAHVGTRFAIAGGGALRLVSVEPLCSGGPTPARSQCFAATFEAAGGGVPEGGATVVVAAPGAGAMPLYVGARSAVNGRERLVAVFN
jgi:hypothetical protein